MSTTTIAALAAAVLGLAGSPAAAAAAVQAGDTTVTISLREASQIALQRAIVVHLTALDIEAAEAGTRSSRALFEPTIALNPIFAQSDGRAVTPAGSGGSVGGTRELAGTVTGMLPTSTRYALTMDSRGTVQDPLTTQAHRTEFNNTMSFTLTQPLLQGFGRAGGLNQREAAELSLRAAQFRRARQVEALLANVESMYYQLAQREAEERAMVESLRRAEELLQRNQELFRLERVTELDVLTSRSAVAQRRSSWIGAQRQRLNAADQLVALIYGADAAAQLGSLAPRLATEPQQPDISGLGSMDAAVERALQDRADVRAALQDIARWDVFLATQRNGLLPALGLSTTWTALGSGLTEPLRFSAGGPGTFGSSGWTAGLSLSYPVGNSRARGALMETRAAAQQAGWLLAQVQNTVRTDVRAGHRGVLLGYEAHLEAASSLELALALYEGEAERHRLGLSDAFRLLQVEETVTQAVLAEIAARYALLSAITQYKLGVGSVLLQEHGAGRLLPLD